MDPERNLAVVHRAVELVNSRDFAGLQQLFTTAPQRHDLAGAFPDMVVADVGDFMAQLLRGAPDMRIELDDAFASGDRVATRIRILGTHQGLLLGREATGRRFVINQLNIYRFEDGKVAESWQLADLAGFDAQIRG